MENRKPLWPAKLGWFVLYWLAGVAALTVVAYAIRWAIH
jgi:hypothetical protein